MKSIKKVITYQIRTLYYRESMGWLRTLYRGARLVNLFGFMILLCLYIIKPFKFVKLCPIHHDRIGHLATNTDLFLRRLQLESIPKKGILYVGISGKPANQQLLKMFKRKLPIIESTFLQKTLRNSVLRKSIFCENLPMHSNEYYEFNNTEPNLYFTAAEEDEGKELLGKMGIDDNSWFICFHSRDPAYLDKYHSHRSREEWSYHDYRDSDIKNYLEAAKYITFCGGFAVRMGYGVAQKLPDLKNPRIIDYATRHRTDFGDIYLHAKCKFSLGDTAGLWTIPTIFHVPVAGVNFTAPFEHTPLRKGDLFVPKKVWSIEKERFLTFREILESEACHFLRSDKFAEAGLEVVENTPEEILDLAKEMNERLDGTFETTDEELQNKYWSFIKPHHWCYKSPARIGTLFLRKNKELLK